MFTPYIRSDLFFLQKQFVRYRACSGLGDEFLEVQSAVRVKQLRVKIYLYIYLAKKYEKKKKHYKYNWVFALAMTDSRVGLSLRLSP